MRFTDQRGAGRALAAALGAYGGREQTIVLALARGGVGVGLEVSKRLGLALDLVFLRRMLLPRGPGEPLCAASVAGSLLLDDGLEPPAAAAHDDPFKRFLADALAELDARVRACRGERPAADLAGKTVLLVDNGVRTGSTMLAAVRALRSGLPARVVAAAPVAAPEASAAVEDAADDFVCLARPEPFGHVGLWYADFRRPSDEEIRAMLEEAATPL